MSAPSCGVPLAVPVASTSRPALPGHDGPAARKSPRTVTYSGVPA